MPDDNEPWNPFAMPTRQRLRAANDALRRSIDKREAELANGGDAQVTADFSDELRQRAIRAAHRNDHLLNPVAQPTIEEND